ncbi:hypothetical protein QBC44DRAFT_333838 [Cladorrhinum sp. PSN332]|nr:hypothetical protein QBC44DRAFT_333838 [Cladorrhinum sp. PSN332]
MQLTATIAATIVGFSSICSGLAIPAAADQANHEVAKRVCTPYWACRVPPPKPKLTVVPIPDIRVIPIEDRSTTTEA